MTTRDPITDKTIIEQAEKELETYFKLLQKIEEANFNKVLNAFKQERISPEHFSWVTGYGHDDLGRAKVDKVFAKIFNTESAIVRPSFVSGTHVISCCFFGCLRPGDELLAIAGKPYDSLHEIIGIPQSKQNGSLKDFGIEYKEIPLNNEREVNLDAIPSYVTNKTKMVFIQRSKGYEWRKSIAIAEIEKIITLVKKINKNIICFVDNCFGELTETQEPSDVGADLVCGSLVKNIGGGIAPCGGYVAGRSDLVDLVASKLTAPGIASEGGCTFDLNRLVLQGLFYAPHVVCEVLKGISLASYVFEKLGFKTTPRFDEPKTDIVIGVNLGKGDKSNLIKEICKIVQINSPINSHVLPVSANLPGYKDKVIMAGGTFIEGSTIELTCDAPMREPYTLYWQGGVNYSHSKFVLSRILESNLSLSS